ncbi:MAG: hypothetical protein ACI915_002399 [Gammaproteobacteria bacterium]|jgi:hypothetical protein
MENFGADSLFVSTATIHLAVAINARVAEKASFSDALVNDRNVSRDRPTTCDRGAGMNVAGLSGTENSIAFIYLAIGTSILAVLLIVIFRWKDGCRYG